MKGTVKMFSPRGFGFIISEYQPDDIWFHIAHYKNETAIEPVKGDRVTFDLAPARKLGMRDQAVNIRKIIEFSPEALDSLSSKEVK